MQTDLEKYFKSNQGRLIHKWHHFFDIYDRHFSRFRNKPVNILEIGVFHGGSLQMWKDYFGSEARIFGVDINPNCKDLEEENIEIYIGSQSDRSFLRNLKDQIPEIDILIDDGGHSMQQQIVTFEELFEHVKKDGIYLCEDIQTSYRLTYGGGYKRRGTFIEYSKTFIDKIHAYHSEQRSLQVDNFTRSVDSVHYYDGIIVLEKRERSAPVDSKTGKESYDIPSKVDSSFMKFKKAIVSRTNKILRSLRLPSIIWK